jgi:hypothetical protein
MTAIDDIRLKLSRAEKHLDALSAEVRDHVENSTPAIRAQHNVLDDSMTAIIENVPVPPREWGVVLGDFLHNARSVLDHLVCALVAASGATVTASHQFPICSSAQQWRRQVTNARPDKSRLGFIDLRNVAVIESLQPYQPGTGLISLLVLQRFSNTDKHRLIHAAVINTIDQPHLTGIWAVPVTISNIILMAVGERLHDGTALARYKTGMWMGADAQGGVVSPGAEHRINVRLRLTTVFGEPGSEDARIKDFRQCLADVRSIVDRFAHVI